MSVKLDITDEMREDLIVTALEGGSNHWYWLPEEAEFVVDRLSPDRTEPFATRVWRAVKAGGNIPVNDVDNEDETLGVLNLANIEKGEQMMGEKYPHQCINLFTESWDADTADIWFQLAVLGEVTYG